MKKAKKLAVLLLTLVMMLSLASTAFAAMEGPKDGGSITIGNAVVGARYDIYQILYLESYNTATNSYAYKANSQWATWLGTQTEYVTVADNGYVTWVKGADTAAFAQAALAYAKTNGIAADKTATATTTTVKFDSLKLGYYLVDTSLGTICSLDTTNPDVTINEKNSVPESDKFVQEDSNNAWGKENDADIGQNVKFKGTIKAGEGAENYVYHDIMSAGLTFKGVSKVTLNGNEVASSNYEVKTTCTDGCTFDVIFTADFCASLKAGDEIVIYYSADVNENAVIGNPGNPNKSYLSYGEEGESGFKTPEEETKTYTWKFGVFKYTLNGETETALAGAVFSLYRDAACTDANVIKLIAKGNNVYRVAKDGEAGAITEITTDASGKFVIQGLDSDTYYLKEIKAPDGFNVISEPIEVVIDENGKVNPTEDHPDGVDEVKVLNQTGSELPSTGGIGTTIFYIVGAVLVVGAAVVLVSKKRMNNG